MREKNTFIEMGPEAFDRVIKKSFSNESEFTEVEMHIMIDYICSNKFCYFNNYGNYQNVKYPEDVEYVRYNFLRTLAVHQIDTSDVETHHLIEFLEGYFD